MAPHDGTPGTGARPETFGLDMVPEIPMGFTEDGHPGGIHEEALDEDRARTHRIIVTAAEMLADRTVYSVAEPNWDRLFEEFRGAVMPAIREFRTARFPARPR